MCVYVYIYIYIERERDIRTYICMYACMYVCVCVYIYIYIYIYRGARVSSDGLRGSSVKYGTIQGRLAWPLRKDDTHTSRSVNNLCMYVYIYMYIHVYIYIYIYICIYTYITRRSRSTAPPCGRAASSTRLRAST